jgi:hypothetical protein
MCVFSCRVLSLFVPRDRWREIFYSQPFKVTLQTQRTCVKLKWQAIEGANLYALEMLKPAVNNFDALAMFCLMLICYIPKMSLSLCPYLYLSRAGKRTEWKQRNQSVLKTACRSTREKRHSFLRAACDRASIIHFAPVPSSSNTHVDRKTPSRSRTHARTHVLT